MCIACWIPKATNTHSEYATLLYLYNCLCYRHYTLLYNMGKVSKISVQVRNLEDLVVTCPNIHLDAKAAGKGSKGEALLFL